MKLIGRYLANEIVLGIAFVMLGFLALFAFFDFINELGDVGRGGYKLQHALGYVLLSLPSHVYELAPIAALIGTIYALAQFASHSEFTAMRAAGLGRSLALREIAKVSLFFVALTALVGEVLAPASDDFARKVRLSSMGANLSGEFRSGLWMKDSLRGEDGEVSGPRFVNVGEVLPDTSLRAIRVFEFDQEFRLVSMLRAGSARYRNTDNLPGWVLSDVHETRFEMVAGPGGEATQRTHFIDLPERLWRSELTPGIVAVLTVNPDRMSVVDLWPYIRHLQDNKQRTDRYEIALWKKIIYPFAVLVMMVLALPFAYVQARAGSIGYKVFAGIMLGVVFHFLNGLFSHLGLLNTWPPWIAVAVPSLVAFAFGLALLWWVERVH